MSCVDDYESPEALAHRRRQEACYAKLQGHDDLGEVEVVPRKVMERVRALLAEGVRFAQGNLGHAHALLFRQELEAIEEGNKRAEVNPELSSRPCRACTLGRVDLSHNYDCPRK